MAIIVNLNDKGFDYLCALADVAVVIRSRKLRGVSADDTLDILIQLGDAAHRQFSEMLEDLQKQHTSAKDEEKAGSPRDGLKPGNRGGCDTGVI